MFAVTPSVCLCRPHLCFFYIRFLFNQLRLFQKHLASHCCARELLSQLLLLSPVLSCALSLYFPLLLLLSSWWRASLPGLSSSRQSLLLHLHHPPSLLPTAALCQPCCPGAAFTSSSHPVPRLHPLTLSLLWLLLVCVCPENPPNPPFVSFNRLFLLWIYIAVAVCFTVVCGKTYMSDTFLLNSHMLKEECFECCACLGCPLVAVL